MEQQTDSTPMYFKVLCIYINRSYMSIRNEYLITFLCEQSKGSKKNRSLAILLEFVIINSEA